MNFNDDYNQIFKDQSSTFLRLPNLNSTIVLSKSRNNIKSEFLYLKDKEENSTNIISHYHKLGPIKELSDNYNSITIEELSDNSDMEGSTSEPIIEEFEDNKKSVNKKKYSEIFFNIDLGEKCHSCSLDSFTLIQKNEEMFHKFLNTSHIYQLSLFNFMKNLITNQ